MKYAYLDTDNILHITQYKRVAIECSKNNKYILTELPSLYGYPVDKDNKIIVMYSINKERKNKPIPPELVDLYKSLIKQNL